MATLTIRLHRKLVATLLDLSTVVVSIQVVLDSDAPLPQLQRVKAYLRLYHQEIVGFRQHSGAFGLTPFEIKKMILKIHQVCAT